MRHKAELEQWALTFHDGLRDMIAGGRLRLADIPEDFQWVMKMLDDMPRAHHSQRGRSYIDPFETEILALSVAGNPIKEISKKIIGRVDSRSLASVADAISKLLLRHGRSSQLPEFSGGVNALRNQKIVEMRNNGKKLRDIAYELDMSPSAVQVVVQNFERTAKRLASIKDIPFTKDAHIDILMLTTRASHALLGSGIDTIGKLLNCPIPELQSIPNLGFRSLIEIEKALARHGQAVGHPFREKR